MSKQHHKPLVELPSSALEQYRRENQDLAQAHLNELSAQLDIAFAMRRLVVGAELQAKGVPDSEEEQVALVERCERLAQKLTAASLVEKFRGMAELLEHLKLRDVPANMVWSARRAGVELFPSDDGAH